MVCWSDNYDVFYYNLIYYLSDWEEFELVLE